MTSKNIQTLKERTFHNLFKDCTGLTSAENLSLPATTLAQDCYGFMFYFCTSLTTAPSLPATTLAQDCYGFMFYFCTSLTTTPKLPATTLASSCYISMFEGCRSLTTAPVLPATTLVSSCYRSMFAYCTSLTTAPSLPATTLEQGCYSYMFNFCKSLTTAPKLPATTMERSCYSSMFSGCTSLVNAPELPAITLEHQCYEHMFDGCTSLITAPELPATALQPNCYSYMFQGCTSLTTAPELPATTLEQGCYSYMFNGCSSLNYIKCLATGIVDRGTGRWVSGVSSSGTFVKNQNAIWTNGVDGIPYHWTVQNQQSTITYTLTITAAGNGYVSYNNLWVENDTQSISIEEGVTVVVKFYPEEGYQIKSATMNGRQIADLSSMSFTIDIMDEDVTIAVEYEPINTINNNNDNDTSGNYLTFVAEESGTFEFSGTEGNGYISYSLDSGNTWNTLANNTNSPTVSAGQKIMWKGTLTPVTGGIGRFSSTGRFQVEGNAMSLLYGDNFIGQTSLSGKDYALNMLFRDCTGLTSAENLSLPATILSYRCYRGMFAGCTGLTTAPSILPALILANNCYENMFYSCTSLTTVPQLPAPTLVHACYNLMFQGCTSLNYIKCLATDISATNCTYNWLYGVSSTGTFVKAQGTAWTTGDSGIPSGWTVQDATTPGDNYLTFVAEETGTFKFIGTTGNDYISYSLDSGNTWSTLARDTDSPTVSAGSKIMWKGTMTPSASIENGIGTFSSTNRFTVECNAHSLLWGDDFKGHTSLSGKSSAFKNLFSGCTGLTSAENLVLPATRLEMNCYNSMFAGCTSLTKAPELPATRLEGECYYGMFSGCASLTKAPTSLPGNSYRYWSCAGMFRGCTSLTTAPELNYNAETYEGCFAGMFDDCTSLSTAPASLPNNMAEMACMSMFRGCTSLTTAPVLPATYIMRYAYSQMFQGCTSLNYIKCLATGMDSSRDATTNWVDGVASSGTFVKATNMSSWETGVDGIPRGWTILNE